jgi:hypothetical protein
MNHVSDGVGPQRNWPLDETSHRSVGGQQSPDFRHHSTSPAAASTTNAAAPQADAQERGGIAPSRGPSDPKSQEIMVREIPNAFNPCVNVPRRAGDFSSVFYDKDAETSIPLE